MGPESNTKERKASLPPSQELKDMHRVQSSKESENIARLWEEKDPGGVSRDRQELGEKMSQAKGSEGGHGVSRDHKHFDIAGV